MIYHKWSSARFLLKLVDWKCIRKTDLLGFSPVKIKKEGRRVPSLFLLFSVLFFNVFVYAFGGLFSCAHGENNCSGACYGVAAGEDVFHGALAVFSNDDALFTIGFKVIRGFGLVPRAMITVSTSTS